MKYTHNQAEVNEAFTKLDEGMRELNRTLGTLDGNEVQTQSDADAFNLLIVAGLGFCLTLVLLGGV